MRTGIRASCNYATTWTACRHPPRPFLPTAQYLRSGSVYQQNFTPAWLHSQHCYVQSLRQQYALLISGRLLAISQSYTGKIQVLALILIANICSCHRQRHAAVSRYLQLHRALPTASQQGPEASSEAGIDFDMPMAQQWARQCLGWLMAAGLALALFLGGSPTAYAAVFPFASTPAAPATLEMKVSLHGAGPRGAMQISASFLHASSTNDTVIRSGESAGTHAVRISIEQTTVLGRLAKSRLIGASARPR